MTHATNPIVHAADDDSVMETLEALPHITRSARAIIGSRALSHRSLDHRDADEPLWLAHHAQPATASAICMADDDPRQRGRFAAAWMRRLCRRDRACRHRGLGAGGASPGPAASSIARRAGSCPSGERSQILHGWRGPRWSRRAWLSGTGVPCSRCEQSGATTVMVSNLSPEARSTAIAGEMQAFETKCLRRSELQSASLILMYYEVMSDGRQEA